MEIFQILPLLTLAAYFFYLTYYYAAPMFFLRILLIIAYKVYRCSEVRFTEDRIIIRFSKDGEDRVLEQSVEVDFTSRFLAMTLRSVLKGMLADIRKQRAA